MCIRLFRDIIRITDLIVQDQWILRNGDMWRWVWYIYIYICVICSPLIGKITSWLIFVQVLKLPTASTILRGKERTTTIVSLTNINFSRNGTKLVLPLPCCVFFLESLLWVRGNMCVCVFFRQLIDAPYACPTPMFIIFKGTNGQQLFFR